MPGACDSCDAQEADERTQLSQQLVAAQGTLREHEQKVCSDTSLAWTQSPSIRDILAVVAVAACPHSIGVSGGSGRGAKALHDDGRRSGLHQRDGAHARICPPEAAPPGDGGSRRTAARHRSLTRAVHRWRPARHADLCHVQPARAAVGSATHACQHLRVSKIGTRQCRGPPHFL